jgi:bifunctional enzyme CysN/CysC
LTTTDEVDISRGDMLAHVNNLPQVGNAFEAMVVWMHETPLKPGNQYLLRAAANRVPATVTALRYQFDINNLQRHPADALPLNGIGRIAVATHRPLCCDSYARNRNTGGFILIDRISNATVAAGMILDREPNAVAPSAAASASPVSRHLHPRHSLVATVEREQRLNQCAFTVWLTGLPKSGKSTLAYALERTLFDQGKLAIALDGENLRATVSADLGFSADDRREHVRRAAAAARLLNDAGIIAIVALVSPYAEDRAHARALVEAQDSAAENQPRRPDSRPRRFIEVSLDCPIAVCRARDTEGLYAGADRGEIEHFSGITAPYEEPAHADVTLKTDQKSVSSCIDQLMAALGLAASPDLSPNGQD